MTWWSIFCLISLCSCFDLQSPYYFFQRKFLSGTAESLIPSIVFNLLISKLRNLIMTVYSGMTRSMSLSLSFSVIQSQYLMGMLSKQINLIPLIYFLSIQNLALIPPNVNDSISSKSGLVQVLSLYSGLWPSVSKASSFKHYIPGSCLILWYLHLPSAFMGIASVSSSLSSLRMKPGMKDSSLISFLFCILPIFILTIFLVIIIQFPSSLSWSMASLHL